MGRTRFINQSEKVKYNVQEEPIVLSKALLDMLLKQDNPANLIALYTFYYYTAKWQKTNQPRATNTYVAEGLNWGYEKVRDVKTKLKDLHLIEDVVVKADDGQFNAHYVKVNFIWCTDHRWCFTTGGFLPLVDKPTPNALSSNSINALSSNTSSSDAPSALFEYITPELFEQFWKIYPKKIDKGKALKVWNKLCKQKLTRPTWDVIKTAIKEQKQSERWQEPEYIPHPSTWLNQTRWIDNPDLMKSFSKRERTNNKPKSKISDGVKYTLDEKTGYYLNSDGDFLPDN